MHKIKLRLYIKLSELIYLTLYDLHDGVVIYYRCIDIITLGMLASVKKLYCEIWRGRDLIFETCF